MRNMKIGKLLLSTVFFAFLFSVANSDSTCGTFELTEDEKQEAQNQVEERLRGRNFPRGLRAIPVVWHVIHDGNIGRIAEEIIYDSIDALNVAFADTRFHFHLKDSTYTDNSKWFVVPESQIGTPASRETIEMTTTLRAGDCSTLNIYSVNSTNTGWLGMNLMFPFMLPVTINCRKAPDAVFIHYKTLPGASPDSVHSGGILVHEVGHWMGLVHTFAGGCTGLGDLVDDTPAQRSANFGCPMDEQPDTCPGLNGLDPIHNYMDYTNDDCANEFTSGQVRRMEDNFNAFRARDALSLIGNFGSCFSPHATAIVEKRGKIPMEDLGVGDKVLTESGRYQTVYTINHFHHTKPTEFVQIHTDLVGNGSESALELSPLHLVYMEGKENPVPAIDVKIGDYMKTLHYGPKRVKKIQLITRNGLYNPITTDGTMIVDGIVTSSYTSFTGSAHLEIAGIELISVHHLLHMTIAPYRALCMKTSSLNICNHHKEGELPFVVQLLGLFYNFWSCQNVPIQFLIICIYISTFSFINFIMSGCNIMFSLPVAVTCWLVARRQNNK